MIKDGSVQEPTASPSSSQQLTRSIKIERRRVNRRTIRPKKVEARTIRVLNYQTSDEKAKTVEGSEERRETRIVGVCGGLLFSLFYTPQNLEAKVLVAALAPIGPRC